MQLPTLELQLSMFLHQIDGFLDPRTNFWRGIRLVQDAQCMLEKC